ncbi:acetamidase/formamidase family protein [Leptolyngbya sp. FACHB-261]|uniref:acetamidase/formamidase family protein n=1 Tax=Leptolyngbya sp. FACHB-261 TaxID=2692806 RepID=UPI0016831CB9|nr:acetamidase/formamidase family protein [Leptolyngbya sp. FACHB-261]MBD2104526.1 acetamidase/formamidase family protein [Leptolyngbya sp. FACHB-261]
MAQHEHDSEQNPRSDHGVGHDCNDHTHGLANLDSEVSEPDPPAQFLSKQSRRAFLVSSGAAAALGADYAVGFLRNPEQAQAETVAAADSIRDAGNIHILKATPQTCFWGFFDKTLPPVLTIDSGDIVYVEALTHHAGDAPDLLMDTGVKEVYDKVTDRGPGVHVMTGPIAVRGAEPGDTLMVRILKTQPRLPYGSNIAAHWGYLYDAFKKERITIYKLDFEAGLAQPAFAYDFKGRPLYDKAGFVTAPDAASRQPFKTKVAIPMRPHFGVMGVAPGESGRINSIPPGPFGGNIDNWRIGAGATMYYPVFNRGANFFIGDPHMAQGDAELAGTAIEASLNGYLQIFVIKDFPITNPILETDTHWITHGFNEDLNKAMRQSADQMLKFLQTKRAMSADEAYTLMSVAVDFGVTQVVDMRQGCHAALPKSLFLPTPYSS